MRLYRLNILFMGKDLYKYALLGYGVFKDDTAVFEFLHKHYYLLDEDNYDEYEDDEKWGYEWTKQRTVLNCGNLDEDFDGEFHDEKYGWEYLQDVTAGEILSLQKIGILKAVKDYTGGYHDTNMS